MIEFKNDETFIVIGASSGIGKAIALRINELGGGVVGVARNATRLEEVRQTSRFPQRFFVEDRDLTIDMDKLPEWMLGLSKKHGRFKGLVLSAGIQQTIPLKGLDIEEAKKLFDINYFSGIAISKGFCDRRVNFGKGSSIIMISSIASLKGTGGLINYSASKGALNSAIKSMAVEVAKDGIRANTVLPGFVMTEMIKDWRETYSEAYIDEMEHKYPLGIGKPEDLTGIVCFLLSDDSRWITGQNIVVDGGGSL
ncbi:SDR family oxidoreductase [Candidatus Saganbacteria bacterium]|nr:SDR family oxidoreductase [Candidatus Saganbacteria bacterium]